MTWVCSRQPPSGRVARRVTSCSVERSSRGSSPAAARSVRSRWSRVVRRHPMRNRMPPRSPLGRSPNRRSRRCPSPSPSPGPVPRTRAIPRHRHRLGSTECTTARSVLERRTGTTPALPHGTPASVSVGRRRSLMERRRPSRLDADAPSWNLGVGLGMTPTLLHGAPASFFCTPTKRSASSAHARDLDEPRTPACAQLRLVALAATEQRAPER